MIAATPRLFSAVATNLTRALCTMVGPENEHGDQDERHESCQ
jgi:hypothetical protein